MAPRPISAILWTLVSLNLVALVAGGLITWLGHSIPVRLKQIGLLPELVMTAGIGSLIVACIGLGALNYSSHHALNIYGFLCTISAVVLLLGLPDTWYKSDHFGDGSLLIDIIYFTLLFLLLLLLVFAFTFAHYLRGQELATRNPLQDYLGSSSGYATPNCTCELLAASATSDDGHHRGGNNSNHGASILNRWIAPVNHIHNNQTSSTADLIRTRSSTNNHRHHLSELRAPSFANNTYNFKDIPCPATLHHLRNHRDYQADQPRRLPEGKKLDRLEPLVHKGFYRSAAGVVGDPEAPARSCSRQLNADRATLVRHFDERCNCFRLNRSIMSLNEPPIGSKDDTLVHYGRSLQHCQPTNSMTASHITGPYQTGRHSVASIARCRCHLKSCSPFDCSRNMTGNESANIDKTYPKLINYVAGAPYQSPFNSTGTYSAQGRHKARVKGSSSVLAATAAAAAAVFGGVVTASPLASGSGCAPDGGQFGNPVNNDDQLNYEIRCDIDNNDHQLGVPMLNSDTSETFHLVNHHMF